MPSVSVTMFLKKYPAFNNIERYAYFNWNPIHYVGESYDYDEQVRDFELYSYNGVLNERIIRKYLCTLFNKNKTTDTYCETYLNGENDDEELENSYEIYKNILNYELDDIMDHIKVVAKAPFHWHKDMEIVEAAMAINTNFGKMLDFLNTLPTKYKKMDYDQTVELPLLTVTLQGVVNYIFDDTVFCQISTSSNENYFQNKLCQVFFYILFDYNRNYYVQNISKNYTIMIYNPLLGQLHTNDINVTPQLRDKFIQQIESANRDGPINFDGIF